MITLLLSLVLSGPSFATNYRVECKSEDEYAKNKLAKQGLRFSFEAKNDNGNWSFVRGLGSNPSLDVYVPDAIIPSEYIDNFFDRNFDTLNRLARSYGKHIENNIKIHAAKKAEYNQNVRDGKKNGKIKEEKVTMTELDYWDVLEMEFLSKARPLPTRSGPQNTGGTTSENANTAQLFANMFTRPSDLTKIEQYKDLKRKIVEARAILTERVKSTFANSRRLDTKDKNVQNALFNKGQEFDRYVQSNVKARREKLLGQFGEKQWQKISALRWAPPQEAIDAKGVLSRRCKKDKKTGKTVCKGEHAITSKARFDLYKTIRTKLVSNPFPTTSSSKLGHLKFELSTGGSTPDSCNVGKLKNSKKFVISKSELKTESIKGKKYLTVNAITIPTKEVIVPINYHMQKDEKTRQYGENQSRISAHSAQVVLQFRIPLDSVNDDSLDQSIRPFGIGFQVSFSARRYQNKDCDEIKTLTLLSPDIISKSRKQQQSIVDTPEMVKWYPEYKEIAPGLPKLMRPGRLSKELERVQEKNLKDKERLKRMATLNLAAPVKTIIATASFPFIGSDHFKARFPYGVYNGDIKCELKSATGAIPGSFKTAPGKENQI